MFLEKTDSPSHIAKQWAKDLASGPASLFILEHGLSWACSDLVHPVITTVNSTAPLYQKTLFSSTL